MKPCICRIYLLHIYISVFDAELNETVLFYNAICSETLKVNRRKILLCNKSCKHAIFLLLLSKFCYL